VILFREERRNDVSLRCLGRGIIHSNMLHEILPYLGSTDLQNLDRCIHNKSVRDVINIHARQAYRELVKEHDQYTRDHIERVISEQRCHGSSFRNQFMIDWQHHTSPMKRYSTLRFGPQKELPFTICVGDHVRRTRHPDGIVNSHLANSALTNSSLATMDGPIMTTGKHFVSFQLQKSTRDPDVPIFRVGVMRPLPQQWWSHWTNQNAGYYAKNFDIEDEDLIRIMNRARPIDGRWQGNIDSCFFDPRNKEMGPYLDSTALLYCSNWDMVDNSQDNPLPYSSIREFNERYTIYNSEGLEEAGLLLDMDCGTLTYFRSGFEWFTVARGLKGEYVWGITFDAQVTGVKTTFTCKTY